MQRYFASIKEGIALLSDEDLFHISHVMRMGLGDPLEVVDKGIVYACQISSLKPLTVKVVKALDVNRELPCKVTLLYALAKGEKTDWVVQKATELGVSSIIGLISERTIVRPSPEDHEKKIARYSKIIKEAAEQSLRNVLPVFEGIIPFKAINKYHFDRMAIAYEGEAMTSHNLETFMNGLPQGGSVGIIIGAEGGFSLDEVNYANKAGYQSVSLGKRILRSETAALYALSIIAATLERGPHE